MLFISFFDRFLIALLVNEVDQELVAIQFALIRKMCVHSIIL